MERNLVLKSQANEVFNAVRERGLDIAEFEWKEVGSKWTENRFVSALIHRPTKYYFVFDFNRDVDKHYTIRSPGPESAMDERLPGNWRNQLRNVHEWLDCVKREIEASDLWSAITQETKLAEAAVASQAANTPFTSEELAHISAGLREIENHLVTTQRLGEEEADFVRQRFDYLADVATRQPRQDWLHLAIGVLFTIVVGVGLTPDVARKLFSFFANIFHELLAGVLALPHNFFPRLR